MSRKQDRNNRPNRQLPMDTVTPKKHADKKFQLPADARALGFISMKKYQAFLRDGNYIEHTS